jgi:hypothetical protein
MEIKTIAPDTDPLDPVTFMASSIEPHGVTRSEERGRNRIFIKILGSRSQIRTVNSSPDSSDENC